MTVDPSSGRGKLGLERPAAARTTLPNEGVPCGRQACSSGGYVPSCVSSSVAMSRAHPDVV